MTQEIQTDELKNRKIYIDYLRVLATMAVIILHTAGANWYSSDVNGINWRVFNFYDSMVRWAVPVFVMISGTLFLGRDIPITKIYSKYVLRLFISFVVWSCIYFLFDGSGVILQFVSLFKEGKTQKFISLIGSHYHLWFLPMIAGLYICVPVIKKIVENDVIGKYYLLLSFIFWSIIPQMTCMVNDFGSDKLKSITNVLLGNVNKMNMSLVMGYTFYFVIGYYLSNIGLKKWERNTIYTLGIVGFSSTVLLEKVVSVKMQHPIENYYSPSCVNVLLESIAIFVLYRNIQFKSCRLNKIIKYISKYCFGIYLVHALVLDKINGIWGIDTISLGIPTYISVPLIALLVFTISLLISITLNQIPIVKKYIV